MYAVFGPSKRMVIKLAPGRVRDLFVLMQILELYEYGYFPLSRMMNLRFIGAWIRRWREVLYYAVIFFKMVFSRDEKDMLSAAVPKIK